MFPWISLSSVTPPVLSHTGTVPEPKACNEKGKAVAEAISSSTATSGKRLQSQFGNSSSSVTLHTSQLGLSPGQHTWLEGVPPEEGKQHSQAPCSTEHFSKGLHLPPRRAEGEQKAAQAVEVTQRRTRSKCGRQQWENCEGTRGSGLGAQGFHSGGSTTEAVPTSARHAAGSRAPPPDGTAHIGATRSRCLWVWEIPALRASQPATPAPPRRPGAAITASEGRK